ncbi:MAG: alpha/beta hydrolase, partial [Bacteroidia bacterium]|nr:alpha/beta hydrolase [Bacteroidia bacterium]
MKTTEWYADSKTFNYNNWGIKYKTGGDEGEILLLIHGFPTSSWDWQKIWPKLTKSYAVVAPDLLGFGQSDKPNGHNYTIHEQAKILESLMLDSGKTNFHILAHDYGNTVTQEMLAAFLDRKRVEDNSLNILSICFLNGGLFPEMHRPVLTQKLLHSRYGFLFNRFLTFRSLEKNLIKVFGPDTPPSPEDLNGFWELINYKNGRSNMH